MANRKGPKGEREVARIIQGWWRRLEPNAVFVRTPKSGGWRGAPGTRSRGDVMPDPGTCERWPFSVEVKRQQAWSLPQLLADRPSPVWKWWGQACEQAEADERHPMLWFRRNRETWFVMLPDRFDVPAISVFPKAWPSSALLLNAELLLYMDPSRFTTAC